MYASNYFEEKILGTLKGVALTAPTSLYVGLFTSDPTETGTGGNEVTYENYVRQKITFTPPGVDPGTQNAITIKNKEDIVFVKPQTDAGTITHIGIFDSPTRDTGKMWVYGRARENLLVRAGQIPVIVTGEIRYYLTGNLSRTYQEKILNVLRGTSLQGVNAHYALFNGAPENAGAELTGGGYVRQALQFSETSQEPAGQCVIYNTNKISFPRPTQNLGGWTHSAIYTAKTNGEPIVITALPNAEDIKQGYLVFADPQTVRVYMN